VTYVISTPGGRKKTKTCHVNMLKRYHEKGKEGEVKTVCITATGCLSDTEEEEQVRENDAQDELGAEFFLQRRLYRSPSSAAFGTFGL